jgi:hypothetical protein
MKAQKGLGWPVGLYNWEGVLGRFGAKWGPWGGFGWSKRTVER